MSTGFGEQIKIETNVLFTPIKPPKSSKKKAKNKVLIMSRLHNVVCSAPGKVILFGEHAVVLGNHVTFAMS
jgi:hypothetical protein